jgi:hypothetical protein
MPKKHNLQQAQSILKHGNSKNIDIEQSELDAQWPGFGVSCKKCGSAKVMLDNSLGFSELSGSWGSIDLFCLDCENYIEIVES